MTRYGAKVYGRTVVSHHGDFRVTGDKLDIAQPGNIGVKVTVRTAIQTTNPIYLEYRIGIAVVDLAACRRRLTGGFNVNGIGHRNGKRFCRWPAAAT
ncbi:hypothetical protein D3C73_1138430 [compost metagenome]